MRAVTRSAAKAAEMFGAPPGLSVAVVDLRDPEALPAALAGVDAVCCCTGTTAFPSTRWDGGNGPEQADYVSVANLVAAACRSTPGLRRFVLTTSAGVERADQFPFVILNLFGVLKYKRMGEMALQGSGLPYTILRPNRLTDGRWGAGSGGRGAGMEGFAAWVAVLEFNAFSRPSFTRHHAQCCASDPGYFCLSSQCGNGALLRSRLRWAWRCLQAPTPRLTSTPCCGTRRGRGRT